LILTSKISKGNGKAYTSEDIDVNASKGQGIELSLGESSKISGKVDNDVHTATDQSEPGLTKPVFSTKGDGETYTTEELAKKLGITVEELENRIQVVEIPLAAE